MILKRWRLRNESTLEITMNLREWMAGIGFDYGMYYLQLGPFSIVYVPYDTIGWR